MLNLINLPSPGNEAQTTIVLMHGYGANKEDLAPIKNMIDPSKQYHWLIPDAPITLFQMGAMTQRAWFHLPQEVMTYLQTGQGERPKMDNFIPPELEEAINLVKEMIAEHSPQENDLILMGFSQGSMMALHLLSEVEQKVKKLVLFSSAMIAEKKLNLGLQKLDSLPLVFQSHGTVDPVLPYSEAERLRDYLKQVGFNLEFHSFQDGHTLPMEKVRPGLFD